MRKRPFEALPHKPVLVHEVLRYLALKPGDVVVDGTIGSGGHSLEILKAIGSGGRLVGLDQDPVALERCQNIFKDEPSISFHHENFKNIEKLLEDLNVEGVDAVILDVGLSSEQLEDPNRGFSFQQRGPLDMRMNPETKITARDLVNELSEKELETLFRTYGDDRWSRRIARSICRQRSTGPLETTEDLAHVVIQALPGRIGFGKRKFFAPAKRHPATRVFQALRIAVNDEMGALKDGLPAVWKKIKPGGKLAVITFHSGEDRVVKHFFKELARKGEARVLTPKPVTPTAEEVVANPRARSAKLRAAERKC